MAQHGYLREFDEAPDRGRWSDDDRERGWQSRSGEWDERDRGWRNERDPNQRNVNFMLGDRDRSWQRDSDRGYFRNQDEQARSSFADEDRQYRGTHSGAWNSEDRGTNRYARGQGFGNRGDWERAPRNFHSNQDDHYRSWRDRQMAALDRDYDDYCREREQQFHRDFDSWRQNRQDRGAQQQMSPEDVMELNNPTKLSTEPQSGPAPIADATLGTNNSENSGTGRGRS